MEDKKKFLSTISNLVSQKKKKIRGRARRIFWSCLHDLEDLIKILDFKKYVAQIIFNLSSKAAYIKRLSELLTMVTYIR